jgi:hypothetical protein
MSDFVPANDLELALASVRGGGRPLRAFLRTLLASPLTVPSSREPGREPLLFKKGGTDMVVAFTGRSRLAPYAALAASCRQVEGLALLRQVPPGCGLALNPGCPAGFALSPRSLERLRRAFPPAP